MADRRDQESRNQARKLQETRRLEKAKQKREEYRATIVGAEDRGDEREAERAKRALDEWTDIVGQRIEQAMREGVFDNLPGKGKPLNLNKNPFVPEDRQMAYKLLENNDLTPGWISERTSVLDAIEAFRQQVHAGVHRHQTGLQSTTDPVAVEKLATAWQANLVGWSEDVRSLNRRIERINLQQPIAHLEIIKLRLPDELVRAGAGTDLLPPG
jgi:hypothetical protein